MTCGGAWVWKEREERPKNKLEVLGKETNSKEEFGVLLGYFGLLWDDCNMYL